MLETTRSHFIFRVINVMAIHYKLQLRISGIHCSLQWLSKHIFKIQMQTNFANVHYWNIRYYWTLPIKICHRNGRINIKFTFKIVYIIVMLLLGAMSQYQLLGWNHKHFHNQYVQFNRFYDRYLSKRFELCKIHGR